MAVASDSYKHVRRLCYRQHSTCSFGRCVPRECPRVPTAAVVIAAVMVVHPVLILLVVFLLLKLEAWFSPIKMGLLSNCSVGCGVVCLAGCLDSQQCNI